MGEALWPRLADAYVQHYVQPAVAACAADSGEVADLLDAASGLEEWAESLGLLEEPCLVPAVEAAVGRVLGAAQASHLAAARTLLLGDLTGGQQPDEPLLVGQPVPLDVPFYQRLLSGQCPAWEEGDPPSGILPDAPLMASGQCKVPRGAAAVAELVGRVLAEAAASGSRVAARAQVGGVCKIALLARELPSALPATAAAALRTVPTLGLLRHNALVHLADALLLQQASHAGALEAVTEEPLTLLREALLLRHAALSVLKDQVSHQLAHLQELMAGLQGLRHVGLAGTAQSGIAARRSIAQVLHSLGRWGRALVGTLTPEAIVYVCCQTMGGLCSAVVSDIMAKGDIGIDECRELKDLLGPLAAGALPALLPVPAAEAGKGAAPGGGADASGVPMAVVHEAVARACRPLRKLRLLLDVILDAPMKQVVAMWERHELQAVGFDAAEVHHLLGALFEDSQHLRAAVTRIRQ